MRPVNWREQINRSRRMLNSVNQCETLCIMYRAYIGWCQRAYFVFSRYPLRIEQLLVLSQRPDIQPERQHAGQGVHGPGRQSSSAHRDPSTQSHNVYSYTRKADMDTSANRASEVNVGSTQHWRIRRPAHADTTCRCCKKKPTEFKTFPASPDDRVPPAWPAFTVHKPYWIIQHISKLPTT